MSDTNEGRRLYAARRARLMADPRIRAWYEQEAVGFDLAVYVDFLDAIRCLYNNPGPPHRRSRVAWSKRKRKRARRRSA